MDLYRRSSSDGSEGDSRAAKRVRASRPKVKSGCITCKARRVKCDETKPQCLRCQKFGRTCDGYLQPTSGKAAAIVPIQPRIPSISIYTPEVSIHSTENESRYFQHFIDHSAKELSGFFDPNFWSRLVLQESLVVPPIRHAVIAIGALNKSLESAPEPGLKVNDIQSINKKHHEQAVFQHLKAIRALNSYISTSDSPQLRTTLVACLLFVCFETFQGSIASSVQQTYGGLKILRSYYQRQPGSRPWRPPRSPAETSSKVVMSERISRNLLSRLGCDNLSREKMISMHLEEFLEKSEPFQPSSGGESTTVSDAFVFDPNVEPYARSPVMAGTNLFKERQRTIMFLPAKQHLTHLDGIGRGQITDATTNEEHYETMRRESSVATQSPGSFRKPLSTSNSIACTDTSLACASRNTSSTFSNSSVSTPLSYTPPSTGTHTPSPSYVPPLQTSLSSQVPSTNQALASTRKRPHAPRTPTPPLHNDFAIEEDLIQTLVRLDGQGLFFGMTPGIPPLIWDIHKTWHLPIPDSFSSFASAQRCWDFLMDRALQFFRRTTFNRAYAPANSDPPEQIAAELETYLNQLDSFTAAFQPILDTAISDDGGILNPAALLLSCYQKITIIMLAGVPSDSEMVYDTFLPEFKYVVHKCALLIASRKETQKPANPRFSFEVGVVPPLHIVATKCRDPVVRRKAVELLFSSPRQEGMWDGVLTARIGKWMTSCEEDGLDPPPLEDSRSFSLSQVASPGEMGLNGGRSRYPSAPPLAENHAASSGFWEGGSKITDIENETVGESSQSDIRRNKVLNGSASLPNGESSSERRKKSASEKGKEISRKRWTVPEENRVRLMVVDFQMPERYIKVKCQKVVPGSRGKGEERETVIAW